MAGVMHVIKIFLWSLLPFLTVPYIVQNNKIKTPFILRGLSTILYTSISIFYVYKYCFENFPTKIKNDYFRVSSSDVKNNPYIFLGYLRSVYLAWTMMIFWLVLTKNHKKIAASVQRLMEISKILNSKRVKKFKIIVIFEIVFIYSSSASVYYTGILKPSSSLAHTHVNCILAVASYLPFLLTEFFINNLLLIVYYAVDSVNNKLESLGMLNPVWQFKIEQMYVQQM